MKPATLRDACWIAANMRAQDRAEIDAVVPLDEPAQVAALLLHNSGDMAFTAHLAGQPVACFGVALLYSHVASGWAYGTRHMRRVVPAMTRHCVEVIAPTLVVRGYRRLEVRTMADHDLSHGWLRGMGAVLETPEPFEFGRHGEMFVTYGWSRSRYMESFQSRVIAEEQDLADKVHKLEQFIELKAAALVSTDELGRMSRQLRHMSDYLGVLRERIANFAVSEPGKSVEFDAAVKGA